jgi:hypothetical protein
MPRRSAIRSSQIDPEVESSGRGLTPYALILIGFSILCILGAYLQNLGEGSAQSFSFDPADEDQVKSLEVTEPNTVFLVEVSQSTSGLPDNKGWSDISVNVQSPDGSTLIAFGSDFWRASGYDEGHWSEQKNRYSMKVTFPIPGSYPVSIESASSPPDYDRPVSVKFEPRRGSTIPLLILGIPSLLAGIGLGYYANRQAVNEALANSLENS